MKIQMKSMLLVAICALILLLGATSVFAKAMRTTAEFMPAGGTAVVGADVDDDNGSRSRSSYILALLPDDDDDDDEDDGDDDEDEDDDDDDDDDD